MKYQNRIVKLEKKIKPSAPGIVIGHSDNEIKKKMKEYKTTYPHATAPLIIMPDSRVKKQRGHNNE